MALPTLTPEQRQQALAKAAEARAQRAQLKADITDGKLQVLDLLKGEYGAYDAELVNKTRAFQVLQAMKGFGPSKVAALFEQCGIAENRRLGGLGTDQRRRLAEALEDA